MGIARLPFHLSCLEQELSICAKDLNALSRRLIALQETLISPQASSFLKQQKTSILLFLESSVERSIYQRVLEELDCWVECANTLDAACHALYRGFDLVLFDLEQVGLDAVTQLKSRQEKSMPQLAALTGSMPPSLKIIGIKHLIQKPRDAYLIKVPLFKVLSEIANLKGEQNV